MVSNKVVSTKAKLKSKIKRRSFSPVQEDKQSTDFEMIIENELPILTEDAEEATIVQSNANKGDKVLYQIEDMDKSVTSPESQATTVEAMLVDNDVNQPTINPISEHELSTPERPSGSSLEEPLPMHVETEIEKPNDEHQISINMRTMPMVESAMVVAATVTLIESNSPQQSNLIPEERSVSLRSNDLNSLVVLTNRNSMSETCSSAQSASIQSVINSENPRNQPCTPERPFGPSLEERHSQSNPSNMSEFFYC